MDVTSINDALARGVLDRPNVLPHLDWLARSSPVFETSFGLDELPEEARERRST